MKTLAKEVEMVLHDVVGHWNTKNIGAVDTPPHGEFTAAFYTIPNRIKSARLHSEAYNWTLVSL
jgi:hypothetical protein